MVFFAICKSTKMINLFSRFVTFHKYQTDRKMCLSLLHFRISLSLALSSAVSCYLYRPLWLYFCIYFICVRRLECEIHFHIDSDVNSIFYLDLFNHPSIQIDQLFATVAAVVEYFFSLFVCLWLHQWDCLPANQLVHSVIRALVPLGFFHSRPCPVQNVLI